MGSIPEITMQKNLVILLLYYWFYQQQKLLKHCTMAIQTDCGVQYEYIQYVHVCKFKLIQKNRTVYFRSSLIFVHAGAV